MSDWQQSIDLSRPCWVDYRSLLRRLAGGRFPTAERLEWLLPHGAATAGGRPIRFVAAGRLGAVDYESHIHRTGEVSTRERSWHDLFNALVWCRLPQLKGALNAMHCRHLEAGGHARRGPQRDALTLFDESGVVVMGSSRAGLRALAARDWQQAFRENAAAWGQNLSVLVCGHALLEKFLAPYKALTAHAVFLALDEGWQQLSRSTLVRELDAQLARRLMADRLFGSPAGLSPLPLMGVPGWWPDGPQDTDFYADRDVFRPPPAVWRAVPIHDLGAQGRGGTGG